MLARLFRADAPSVHSHVAWEDLPDEALPPPPLREGLGDAHLPVTTRVPLAQAYFDQGLRLLHLGWVLEARRAFAEAARQDPSLAMAWWGLTLARGVGARFTPDRAEASRKALTLAEGATDLEQRLVVAASLLADKGPANGRPAFVREMECLTDRFPQEPEPRLLLAGFLLDGYESDGRPGLGQPYAQLILRDLLRAHPRHAGVHMAWVQAWLPSSRPEMARESAELLPSLVPAGSPALLASGRLLLRLGRGLDANRCLEAAVTADDAYVARESLPLDVAPSAETALRLLSEGCAEVGQYRGAQVWARKLRQRVEAAGPQPQAVLFAATTLVAAHLRFGFCRAAAEVPMELGTTPPSRRRGCATPYACTRARRAPWRRGDWVTWSVRACCWMRWCPCCRTRPAPRAAPCAPATWRARWRSPRRSFEARWMRAGATLAARRPRSPGPCAWSAACAPWGPRSSAARRVRRWPASACALAARRRPWSWLWSAPGSGPGVATPCCWSRRPMSPARA